jgi:hypothetical protein
VHDFKRQTPLLKIIVAEPHVLPGRETIAAAAPSRLTLIAKFPVAGNTMVISSPATGIGAVVVSSDTVRCAVGTAQK